MAKEYDREGIIDWETCKKYFQNQYPEDDSVEPTDIEQAIKLAIDKTALQIFNDFDNILGMKAITTSNKIWFKSEIKKYLALKKKYSIK